MLKQMVLLITLVIGLTMTINAQSDSQVMQVDFESVTLDRIYQYQVYLPAGYDDNDTMRYPVVYLLHGRGDTMAGWLTIRSTLDQLIADGELPPMIAVMPDMPSSDRGNYYVDSAYTGFLFRAEPVETAFFSDLIPHIDSTYRTLADRQSRVIGGYSMGGYGAIRYVLAHPDQFMGALVLSPAVYTPQPPRDSSVREFGAFGSGDNRFDEDIYTQRNYPALLEQLTGEHRLNIFIAVGDDEWKHPDPEDIEHDLDFESHRFFNRVARIPSIASEFRVYDGGHDWDVWTRGFVEGMRYLSRNLNTSSGDDTPPSGDEPDSLNASQLGTTGDDFAGGIATNPDTGDIYQALAVAGSLNEQPYAGGLDMAVVKYDANRAIQWTRQLGTTGDDRPYGLVVTPEDEIVVVGYTQGDFDGVHGGNNSDDIVVFKLNSAGDELWRTQLGTPDADRGYGIALAVDSAVVITGYTKGDLAQANAGDKDIFTAMISTDGQPIWVQQTGGDGEDKGQTIAVNDEGVIYTGGMTTSQLGDGIAGGIDAFVMQLSATGDVQNVMQFGTAEWDEVTGMAIDTGGAVVITGFTGGALSGDFVGDKDIFMQVLDANLQPIAGDQLGTNLNDKGASITMMENGDMVLAGYSDGEFVTNIGGFDVILVRYSPEYQRLAVWQYGSLERDGADEWAEKNLFITAQDDGVLVSGLTVGAMNIDGFSGGSDVFIIAPDGVKQLP